MIIGRIYAMGRPPRPGGEREAVRAAVAEWRGSKALKAHRLAAKVAEGTLAHLDGDHSGRILALLAALEASPIARLIADPEIDTAAAIRAERALRAEACGWRRLSLAEAAAEDVEIVAAVTELLAKRYARHLVRFQP